jgi:hypothetical protein
MMLAITMMIMRACAELYDILIGLARNESSPVFFMT